MAKLPMETTNETHEDIEVYKTILENRVRKIVEEHCQLYLDGLFNDLEIIEKKITIVKKYLRLIRDHVKSNASNSNANKSDPNTTNFNKKYFKRRTYGTRGQVQKEQQTSSDSSAQVEKVKEVTSSQSNQAIFKEKRYLPQISAAKKVSLRGQRFKECKIFIVGNISQALQPSVQQQQMLTHRWLLYVRGPKTCPDISEYVSCVRFYLHESYKPDDVVNVRKPPFHVSRRGWGAFLTKVVIFFKLEKNKPMQIFHKLQLDTSFSGMQTLGAETVVKKWIYLYDPRMFITKRARSTSPIENENENEEEAPPAPTPDLLLIRVEHNYSKCVFTLQAPRETSSDKCGIIRDNPSQVFPLKFLSLNQQSSKIMRPVSPKQNMHGFEEKLNKAVAICKKLNTAQAVGWLLEIMPAVTANAAYPQYKMLHPYSAVSLKEFHSWNEAKKYFHAIYRCKMIENFLRRAGVKVWSHRRILDYARKRGYIPFPRILTMKNQENIGKATPLRKFPYQRNSSVLTKRRKWRGHTKVKSSENKIFKNAYTEPTEILKYVSLNETGMDSNEEVEILYSNPVSGDEDEEICELCDLPESLLLFHSYISKHLNLLNCLWRNKLTNSAWISIAVATRIFVKDLFRRSLRKAWAHYNSARNLPISICAPDVAAALRSRKEFDFLLRDGLGLRGEFHYE